MFKFPFVRWLCKFQTHNSPSWSSFSTCDTDLSEQGFLDSFKSNVIVVTEFLAISEKNTSVIMPLVVGFSSMCKGPGSFLVRPQCYLFQWEPTEFITSGVPTKHVEVAQPLITLLKIRRMFFTEVPRRANKNIYLYLFSDPFTLLWTGFQFFILTHYWQ